MASSHKEPKITATTLKVLAMFLDGHPQPLAGSDIFNRTHIFSGTLYPILSRLETAGWLKAEWEEIDPSEAGRPRRRFYSLTATGKRRAAAELASLQIRAVKSNQVRKGAQSWT